MAIYPLMQHAGFEPERIQAMGQAFEETLAALDLKDRADPLVLMVARKIIELGQRGAIDADHLRDQAIKALTT